MKVYTKEHLIENGKTLHIFSICGEANEARHTHDFIEIIYYTKGVGVETVNGKSYKVGRGDIIFINRGATHEFHSEGEVSFYNVCFSPEVMAGSAMTRENATSLLSLIAFDEMRLDSDVGKISLFGRERAEVESLFSFMLAEYREKGDCWNSIMESYLSVIITKMMRASTLGIPKEELLGMWRELSDYIEENLREELSLSSLAAKYFYNPSYFSRVFKERFGETLVEYVNGRRVEHATRLLSDTELSVGEISDRAGFSDRSSFYHAFSKRVGCTPSEYRKVKKSDK